MGVNDIGKIPQELRNLHQFVVWRGDKIPRQAITGARASVDDPSTWSTFSMACQAVEQGRAQGVGFVFTEDDPYVGIDLDKVIAEDGEIDPHAQDIIVKLDSYTEISQSGNGVHIIVRGKKPGSKCRKKNVELYDHGRYFALTGDIYEGRATIEDRQDELECLVQETFGEEAVEDQAIAAELDLVLDPDANPPPDKLDLLLKSRVFASTWKHQRKDVDWSLSEYDFSLASQAKAQGWDDQEVADLIIAFRRKHGETEKDRKKALRLDYISGILGKLGGIAVLSLLPFKVERVLQLGVQDPEYELELEDGRRIRIGDTSVMLSARRADQRFYDADYPLSKQAIKRWREIAVALRKITQVVDTTTREDTIRDWIIDYTSTRWEKVPLADSEERLSEIFRSHVNAMARDREGRVYMKLYELAAYVKTHSGAWNYTAKRIAHDLGSLGFKKIKIDTIAKGRRYRPAIWMSPPGFYPYDE